MVASLVLLLVSVVAAAPARADTITAGGTPLSSGDHIDGTSNSAMFTSQIGDIDCVSALELTVTVNPAATAGPADVRMSSCTDTIPFVVVYYVESVGDTDVTFQAAGSGDGWGVSQGAELLVATSFGSCWYSGDLVFSFYAPSQWLSLIDNSMGKTSGSSFCPNTIGLNVTYDADSWEHVGPLEIW